MATGASRESNSVLSYRDRERGNFENLPIFDTIRLTALKIPIAMFASLRKGLDDMIWSLHGFKRATWMTRLPACFSPSWIPVCRGSSDSLGTVT
jgi:hypothetical protein